MDYFHLSILLFGALFIAAVTVKLYKVASNIYQDFVDFSQRFRGVK